MSTQFKINVGFALACFLVLVSVFSSHRSTSQFIDDSRWMVHTVEVKTQIERVTSLFIQAQNNIRAYYMTEQPYYLNLYNQSKNKMFETTAALRKILSDNPVQVQSLDEVIVLLQDKAKTWEESFERYRKGGFNAIRTRMLGDTGKDQDQVLFAAFDQFKAEEARLLAERIARAEVQGQEAKFVMWISGILACFFVIFAAYLVIRDRRRREVAEADMDRFFNLSLDLLCISGMDGYFKRLSPSYSEVLGYPMEDLLSKPVTDFVHPDDIQRTNDEIGSQMQGNKVLAFENRFRTKNGKYRTFSWKSVPVGDRMYAVARDVTQQKEFERELLEARQIALNTAVAKGEFLARMSHEIRTPLNGIIGMADLLSRTSLDQQQKDFLGAVRTSGRSLMKIVNEVLDFSKIEAGRIKLEKVDFDLAQIIEAQISLIGVAATEKNVKLDVAIDPQIPRLLRGDSVKVGQILLNLLNNAVKFTEKGAVTVRAQVVCCKNSFCKIRFNVTDTGIGLTPKEMEQLFQPYTQAEESTSRKFGGTGLGLSICKSLVELMDGQMGVESQPGQGSTFWFLLKLEVPAFQVLNGESLTKPLMEYPNDKVMLEKRAQIRVLIAEDNLINQAVITSMMNILGYQFDLAKNGQEAVEMFEKKKFDIVMMDQNMPIMDGLQASAEIRKIEGSKKRTPIIAFTATVIQDDQKAPFKELMDDFILKPVAIEVLEKVLDSWTEKVLK